MTAIRNGFNYLDIVFPIRKTLNRFMKLKIFDNFVRRNTSIKGNYNKALLLSVERRLKFIIIYVFFVKYKLFIEDLNVYSNSFNDYIYLKTVCFSNVFVYLKSFYCKEFVYKHIFGCCKSHIFKRFFSNVYKKTLFEFLQKRATAETVDLLRRLKRKPLTLVQKQKYNEKRRIKRQQDAAIIHLSELKEVYDICNERFSAKISRLRRFSYLSINRLNSRIIVKRFYDKQRRYNDRRRYGDRRNDRYDDKRNDRYDDRRNDRYDDRRNDRYDERHKYHDKRKRHEYVKAYCEKIYIKQRVGDRQRRLADLRYYAEQKRYEAEEQRYYDRQLRNKRMYEQRYEIEEYRVPQGDHKKVIIKSRLLILIIRIYFMYFLVKFFKLVKFKIQVFYLRHGKRIYFRLPV